MRLTEPKIKAAEPRQGQYTIPDDLSGFGLRVSQGGTKTFVLMLPANGKKKRLTLGRYPHISLADARATAKKLIAKHTLSPFTEEHVTVSDAIDVHLHAQRNVLGKETLYHKTRHLRSRFKDIENLALTQVTPAHVLPCLTK
jgi:hypothetical protein